MIKGLLNKYLATNTIGKSKVYKISEEMLFHLESIVNNVEQLRDVESFLLEKYKYLYDQIKQYDLYAENEELYDDNEELYDDNEELYDNNEETHEINELFQFILDSHIRLFNVLGFFNEIIIKKKFKLHRCEYKIMQKLICLRQFYGLISKFANFINLISIEQFTKLVLYIYYFNEQYENNRFHNINIKELCNIIKQPDVNLIISELYDLIPLEILNEIKTQVEIEDFDEYKENFKNIDKKEFSNMLKNTFQKFYDKYQEVLNQLDNKSLNDEELNDLIIIREATKELLLTNNNPLSEEELSLIKELASIKIELSNKDLESASQCIKELFSKCEII